MDSKLFVFMVLLLTFLTTYSTAYKNGNSSLIKGKSYRRGSRHSKVHHNTTYGNRNRQINHNDNLNIRNAETNQSENTENIPKEFIGSTYEDKVTVMMRDLAKESDSKSVKRGSRDYNNDGTDTTAIENYPTDVTNNGEETPTQPIQQRTRKAKRRMKKKQNKKYKPGFKFIKIKNKKRNKENKLKTDILDNAEGILVESQEVYSERIPTKTRKQKGKKGNTIRKQYNNIGENNKRNRDKTGGSKRIQYRKKKAGKTKNQKKKHNLIHTTTQNTEDYSEKIISDEVEETTKYMHKPYHERTEIIYLTPIPRHRKYNPEFRYIRIDSEPMNYDSPYNRNTPMDHSHESDKSKSISNETEEIDSDQNKATNWAETYKFTDSQEDNSDDDDAADTVENNESEETEDSDHDHDSLKIRRTAEEKWDDLEVEHVNQKRNAIINKLHKTQNYHKKKTNQDVEGQEDKTVSPNDDVKEVAHTRKTTSHLDILDDRLAPVLQYGKKENDIDIPQEKISTKCSTPHDNILLITFEEDRTGKYEPVVQYNEKYKRMREKIFGRRSTRDVTPVMVTEEPKGRYEPVIEYIPIKNSGGGQTQDKEVTRSTFTEDMRRNYRPTPKHSKQYETIYKEIFSNRPITHEPLPTVMVTEEPKGRYEQVIEYIPTKNSGRGQAQDEEVTRGIFKDQSIETLVPALEDNKPHDGSPEQTYVKRSTLHETVKVVKISQERHKKKEIRQKVIVTTNQPYETTTMEDYDEMNTNPDKETEKPPSYQVNENVIDIPDTRHIPGPIVPNYAIASDQKIIPTLNTSNKISAYNPLNIPTYNEQTEHPFVNIVQGMKDYFTVIGRGLYNTVKDIFKEETRRRRSIESQENNNVNNVSY